MLKITVNAENRLTRKSQWSVNFMVFFYKLSFIYLLVFSVVAFDNGQRFQVSDWLFFINAKFAYAALFYMMVISGIFLILETKMRKYDRFFISFFAVGLLYICYSFIYGVRFSYISYNQIGFVFIAASFLFVMDTSRLKSSLLVGYSIMLFFAIAMSLVKYYDLDLPIVRYSDLDLDSTAIRASSGLFLQTNASGAFFCLSALIFLSLYNYTRHLTYIVCCFICIVCLLVGKSLGPIGIFFALAILYANKSILLAFSAIGLSIFFFKLDYFIYYLNYKLHSGSTKYDVFLGTVERFYENTGDLVFGQFYSGNTHGLLYTESSMLDIINNFGIAGAFWAFAIGIAGLVLALNATCRRRLTLFLPVIALFVLSLTQNSTLMLVHIFIVCFYLATLHAVSRGVVTSRAPLVFKVNHSFIKDDEKNPSAMSYPNSGM
ncbi:hypothetical protein [Enterovibrio paralichthyis]|uniref:hypothetical protein n=1 Tax=Enterovibrio paralichthyis TaxID=2853805 RepID=UPI001C4673CE|nr:hypothetical protein [Enterovibrio paralichthyis]MBV7298640.1 hypothetical protein [Enterovibrio paralichthyis]